MSEAVLAPSTSPPPHLLPARAPRNRLSSLEALERGFALFRSTFGRDAWRYYTGTAPLVLGFIPIWVINGQIQISSGAQFVEAIVLAGGYLLRVGMVSSYMGRVRERAFSTPTAKPKGAVARAAAVSRLLTWKILLGAASLTTLPSVAGASWFYSACQFASLEAQDGEERRSFSGCLALSSQWFGGGLLLFLAMFPLWTAVWLNGLILAMILPQLLHSIFGVNTLLSTQMGMFALFQSSAFWLFLFSGAWLALDPIVKCAFVVVYQHLRSRREGDDLRGLLASLPHEQQKKAQMILPSAAAGRVVTGALLVLAMILAGGSLPEIAHAAEVSSVRSKGQLVNPGREERIERLRQALDRESQRTIYRWHDDEHPEPPTWFDKLLVKTRHSIEHAWNAVRNFFRKLWPRGLSPSLGNQKSGNWHLRDLRFWLTLVMIVFLVAAGGLFWGRRRRGRASLSIALAVEPVPDLSDPAAASERSEEEWFVLAGRLEGEGELRFALRASYFGLLAGLGQREWLTIRRDRTNREYLHEFTRRWRRRPQASLESRAEIPERLRGSFRQFDRVWYGFHALTPEAVTTYRQDQREFLKHV